MKESMKYVGVWIERDTHTELKVEAVKQQTPMGELLRRIIEDYLKGVKGERTRTD